MLHVKEIEEIILYILSYDLKWEEWTMIMQKK